MERRDSRPLLQRVKHVTQLLTLMEGHNEHNCTESTRHANIDELKMGQSTSLLRLDKKLAWTVGPSCGPSASYPARLLCSFCSLCVSMWYCDSNNRESAIQKRNLTDMFHKGDVHHADGSHSIDQNLSCRTTSFFCSDILPSHSQL